MTTYDGEKVVSGRGVYKCTSPVAEAVFYLDTEAPDFRVHAQLPLMSNDGAYLEFTDLKTGQRVKLYQDSLNYHCEFIGELKEDDPKYNDNPEKVQWFGW
jgi:hypothetical protein